MSNYSRKRFKDISIKTKIFISFIIILLCTVITIGYITYSSWINLVNETVTKNVNNLNQQITSEINLFIRDAKRLNIANQELIEKGIIDISDETTREQFFVSRLKNFDGQGIYSFSYGTEAGEYYGARRNENNQIEIMRNNDTTRGHSYYYFVENGVAGQLALDAGKFDPRTRRWYQEAKESNRPIFSPIYKHFVLDDLAVSTSIAIHDEDGQFQGVLGSHINLSRINDYLEDIVFEEKAYAMIVEKESGEIVANSLGKANFETMDNGQVKRLYLKDMNQPCMAKAFSHYSHSGTDTYIADYENDKLHIKLIDYQDQGLDWVVITALPDSLMVASIKTNIKIGLMLTVLAIGLSSYLFAKATRKYVKPIYSLIQTQEDFANGQLLKRETIVRNDEIGMLARSFNAMADTICVLIKTLEKQVQDRTQALNLSERYFETILLSVGDGVIATDSKGMITVMNPVIESLTGYSIEQAIGKPLDKVLTIIHDTSLERRENPAKKVLASGDIIETFANTMLVTNSKQHMPVEYTAAPIKSKEGSITGVVIVLRDITDQKEKLDQIKHLSIHDQLTGLYNRWHMEKAIVQLNQEENLPLTVMVVDVNGLKLVNDAFGHDMGDQLLQVVSKNIKNTLRSQDVVGRTGGDEFLILLPKTDKDQAEHIKESIHQTIALEKLDSVIISVAIGYTVKENMDESIETIRISADNQMYKNKLVHGKTMRNQTIETVLRNINYKYDQEQIHTERVSQYCESIARAMGFPQATIEDIKTAGALHDIGKIIVPLRS